MSEVTFEFAHVGVNGQTAEEAKKFLAFCQNILNFGDAREIPLSFFIADNKMELMKEGGRGTLGHLAFYTPDMNKAIEYLKEKGYDVNYDTARYEEDGKTIRLIYLAEEMNGFAIHLTTKK